MCNPSMSDDICLVWSFYYMLLKVGNCVLGLAFVVCREMIAYWLILRVVSLFPSDCCIEIARIEIQKLASYYKAMECISIIIGRPGCVPL